MDPTLAPGQMPMPQQAANPQAAMQNAMMLQALQGGGAGGGAAPPPQTGAAMGPQQMGGQPMPMPQMATPPVDPSTMPGGLAGSPQGQPNPIAAALMSQIPGGGQ